uniref:IS3 family transposase n=1 Tax=Streptomyces alanosinicus TaxID=68171 RepID=UPI0035713B5B
MITGTPRREAVAPGAGREPFQLLQVAGRGRRADRTAGRRPALAERIRAVHADSGGAYGSPRITAELRADGRKINERTGGSRDAQVLHPGHTPVRTGPHHDLRAVGDTGPGPVPAGLHRPGARGHVHG